MAYTNNNSQTRVGVRIVPLSVVIPTISTLLDSYSGAAAAYSLRKLKSSYTGSAIRVRRSSDNTEMNIGFDSNGNLDTIALSVFVGTGDGFVTTWHDQSGNGNNAVQTTASSQPQIVSAGSVITMSNKPSVSFTTSNMSFTQIAGVSGLDIFVVSNFTDVTGGGQNWNIMSPILAETGGNAQDFVLGAKGSKMAIWAENNNSIFLQTTATISINTPYIYNGYGSSTSVGVGFNDGNYVTGTGRRNDLIVRALGKNSTSMQFYGNLSEVVVYNSLQTANRSGINTNLNTYYSVYPNPTSVWNLLNAVYSADTTASSSLKTSLFAVYNGEYNTNDSKGTNNGTAVGGVTYPAGKIGTAFQFNGTNAYVSLPNTSGQFNFDGDFTVSVWFRTSNLSASRYFMTNDQDNGTTWGYGWSFFYSGSLGFTLQLSNGSATNRVSFQSGYAANTWYHVVAVRKMGQKHKIYVNGVDTPAGQYGDVNTPAGYIANQKMELAGISRLNLFALCDLDGVNMWNKALTQAEVSELYNSGNGAQYIGDNFYKPTTNDALGTNNGTAVGGLTYGLGKVGTAFIFNGTTSYVSLPNSSGQFNLTGDFSVSCWFKTSTVSGNQIIFSNLAYNGGVRKGFFIVLSSNTIGCWLINQPTYAQEFYTSAAVSINTWYHLSVTRESGVVKIYLNGTLLATDTNGIPLSYVTTLTSIGAYTHGAPSPITSYFNGSIDAFNIWQKALTQSEVTELYNSGNGKQYPN